MIDKIKAKAKFDSKAAYTGNVMSQEEAELVKDNMKGGVLYNFYVNSPLADTFDKYERLEIKTLIYKLIHDDLKCVQTNTDKGNNQYDNLYHQSALLMQKLYWHYDFPFGYQEDDYNRHEEKMKRVLKDVKEKVLDVPNFNSNSSCGLDAIRDYMSNRKWADKTTKPIVRGKTILLFDFPNMSYDEQKAKGLILYTFFNKFENVEVPPVYMIKMRNTNENYMVYSFLNLLNDLYNKPLGYKMNDEKMSKFEVICFNTFLFPIRDKHIEVFMNYIISFQNKHPNIYIKDVSGKGYNAYKKYSFYNKLKDSLIDVSVIK